MDIEDWDGSPAAFERYCKENDVSLPDLATATPACVRDINLYRESRRIGCHLDRLTRHRDGACAEWIEPVLTITAVPKPKRGLDYQQMDGAWHDEPLPNWVLAFKSYDPITQAFDEERQHMYDCSHAPTWIESFDPSNANNVRRVLLHVQNMILLTRSLAG